MSKKISKLCIISINRSGTNYFCDSLNGFEQVYSAKEIFGEQGSYGIEGFFPDVINEMMAELNIKDDNPFSLRNSRPLIFTHKVTEKVINNGFELFSFKIFPNQLDNNIIIERFVKNSDYLKFLIVRSRVDVYLSLQKALLSGAWLKKNTTDIELKLSVDDFLKWCRVNDEWYNSVIDCLIKNNQKFKIISYNNHINISQEHLNNCIYYSLRESGLDIKKSTTYTSNLVKQEKMSKDEREEKYHDFFQELREIGMYDYAYEEFL
ncbi:hypothetical protein [Vibrio nitrifigilis]|uniref:Sulphotransferase Stf0 domain-containing protein n=1 Tax=Vibrio nitrifigilis TaxID=2789781 RepID=A0ABS0GFT8_9VIBR|nr:hypothetical protein [Vibrio nitrifigilis]MBF9001205.1 hypothetical protein [Vibrio nitrifigilis]